MARGALKSDFRSGGKLREDVGDDDYYYDSKFNSVSENKNLTKLGPRLMDGKTIGFSGMSEKENKDFIKSQTLGGKLGGYNRYTPPVKEGSLFTPTAAVLEVLNDERNASYSAGASKGKNIVGEVAKALGYKGVFDDYKSMGAIEKVIAPLVAKRTKEIGRDNEYGNAYVTIKIPDMEDTKRYQKTHRRGQGGEQSSEKTLNVSGNELAALKAANLITFERVRSEYTDKKEVVFSITKSDVDKAVSLLKIPPALYKAWKNA